MANYRIISKNSVQEITKDGKLFSKRNLRSIWSRLRSTLSSLTIRAFEFKEYTKSKEIKVIIFLIQKKGKSVGLTILTSKLTLSLFMNAYRPNERVSLYLSTLI